MGIKITRSWLSNFVETDMSNSEIGTILTNCGIELDEIIDLKPEISGVVTGFVKEVSQHPDADKLKVCQVAVANDDIRTIVCGCSSVKSGIHVAVATVGARLPGGMKIKKSKLRGVVSQGMLCSLKELGLSENSSGIVHLENVTDLGIDIIDHLKLDDVVLDFDVTPNRGDCLSLRGLIRELDAFSSASLKPLEQVFLPEHKNEMPFRISVLADSSAPIYTAAYIKDINVNATNLPVVGEILEKIDVGKVNSPVDTANYLMFESGQPFHVFDADRIEGDVFVRYAKSGESVTVLSGVTYDLDESVLVIADSKKILAIAGIIGAESVAVTDKTKNIFVESAFFDQVTIAKTCRKYNLSSDSAFRFERGVDYGNTEAMRNKLVKMLLDNVGGCCMGSLEIIGSLPSTNNTTLTMPYVSKVLGLELAPEDISSCLDKIGALYTVSGSTWNITPPSWRFDLTTAIDYVEEVLRCYGYEKLPQQDLVIKQNPDVSLNDPKKFIDNIRSHLISRGLREVISYSFISKEEYNLFANIDDALQVLNPISSNMEFMRSSLTPGLLKCASRNYKRQHSNICIFETGQCFQKNGSTNSKVAALFLGSKSPLDWQQKSRDFNFFDVKGELEELLNTFGIDLELSIAQINGFHPGRSANIQVQGDSVGFIAAVHPSIAGHYDLPDDTFIFEIDLSVLGKAKDMQFSQHSKLPGIRRDLSLLVPLDYCYEDLYREISQHGSSILKDIRLFDVYTGDNMKKGEKSLAISLFFQHDTRTLRDSEVNELMGSITINLNKINIQVRV